ncbi:hypothetical protein IF1G_11193 [Cordyceps javanica]|uniref:Uncharacterized protein n=1 Tax=Cordyceps javanica TaxID=43265 RepID=A0A545VIV0_9HYPO|nr:hypothetical protein IF1G_11193 [Cordyceps javanica]TQW01647.1 hemolysin-III related domain-containing protein [Cordyceps javanica]
MPQRKAETRKTSGAAANPTTKPSAALLAAKQGLTLTWQEAAKWQRKKYILSGYQFENSDYLTILTSLTSLHSETCNMYTHLIGALLLPFIATTVMRGLADPQSSPAASYVR